MSTEIKGIIKRLRECVENSKLSYVELEKRTNIAKSSIQRYVSGSTKKIPIDAVQSIAKAVGVSPEYILGWDKQQQDTNQMLLTNHEKNVITAYRDKPEMQPAVDKLLGVNDEEMIAVPMAARSESNRPVEITQISKEMSERIKNATPVVNEEDI